MSGSPSSAYMHFYHEFDSIFAEVACDSIEMPDELMIKINSFFFDVDIEDFFLNKEKINFFVPISLVIFCKCTLKIKNILLSEESFIFTSFLCEFEQYKKQVLCKERHSCLTGVEILNLLKQERSICSEIIKQKIIHFIELAEDKKYCEKCMNTIKCSLLVD